MTDPGPYLICPTCEHVERPAETDPAADEGSTCPECGSERAYRASDPSLLDAEGEAYVKLDPDSVGDSCP